MHLAGVYTPALHSSFLSFKSSLQEDRRQRHKHKIIKEPQTQSEWTDVSFNAPSSADSPPDPELIRGQLGAGVSVEARQQDRVPVSDSWAKISSHQVIPSYRFYPKTPDCLEPHLHLLPLGLNDCLVVMAVRL